MVMTGCGMLLYHMGGVRIETIADMVRSYRQPVGVTQRLTGVNKLKADERKGEKFLLSYKPVFKYNLIFCILILLTFIVGGIYHSFEEMKWTSKTTMNAAKWQIEYRIKQSIRLLESCAAQEQYRDPSLPYMDKVNSLNQINRHFGYMMIRYVDQNINVYSARGATSLASREYMQRLFTTGKVQVTDSFAAGADGVTLNYTVAVPLY